MATRTTAVGTQSGGDYLTAAEYNAAAGGWIGWVQVTSDQTSMSTLTDLTSLTLTVTVGSSRYIKITGFCRLESTSTSGGCELNIREGSTVLEAGLSWTPVSGFSTGNMVAVVLASPSSGSHTYKLSVDNVNAGNAHLRASSTKPAWLLVEDIGAA